MKEKIRSQLSVKAKQNNKTSRLENISPALKDQENVINQTQYIKLAIKLDLNTKK